MSESSQNPAPPYCPDLTEAEFRVWASHDDAGAVELRADVGVTAERLSGALSRFLPAGVRLVDVEQADDDQGAVLLRFAPAGRPTTDPA